ncbi:MAG: hypothetical protein ACOZAN_01255 [Patescibacteria group bacterium]
MTDPQNSNPLSGQLAQDDQQLQSDLAAQSPIRASLQTDPQTPMPGDAKDAQQDPLAALESILQDAKKNQTGGSAANQAAQAAAEEAEKLAEIAQLEEEKRLEDQQHLEEKLQELHRVAETPEYQVRIQQDEQKKVEQKEKIDTADKLQIHQLGHTKV